MNILGVKFGGRIQVTFTVIKIAALAGLVAVGLWLGSTGAVGGLVPLLPKGRAGAATLRAFGTAMSFLSLGVVALMVLRVREPDLGRPYRVFAYPLTRLLFLGVFAWYLVNSLVFEFRDTMVGIVMALSGLPFYFLWFRRGGAERG